ncbi:hypothetical protein B9Z55_019601 [Caenorhabditis nigoni]|uniref:Major sperm protein n=1 Tax=Caenorhabditis nigoni TaxID=1611254 RepID=A0A2G5TJ23_9PELO|nr:hypothetical protein B9Z55_019601 [Caenorhabditis nigoni]
MSKAETDLTKVVFNPSKSFTFQPVARKQQATLEITNNSTSSVLVKFKNTNPDLLMTVPKTASIRIGEKKVFKCTFKGAPKEKCRPKERFTVVLVAASENADIAKVKGKAHKTACLKHLIQIIFVGVNDQKEKDTQQPTNVEDDEDKDRQGQMRAKSKVEPTPKVKKTNLIFLTRPEEESISDEDEENGGTVPAGPPPGDDMMTTRPAGTFTGQVASNPNAAENPKSEFRTTRPAGTFTGQTASNAEAAGGAPVSKSEMKTTRPAGTFTGQTASNPTPGAPVDPKSTGMQTTRAAGAYNGQVTPNPTPGESQDLKTTKNAGAYDNPQKSNK